MAFTALAAAICLTGRPKAAETGAASRGSAPWSLHRVNAQLLYSLTTKVEGDALWVEIIPRMFVSLFLKAGNSRTKRVSLYVRVSFLVRFKGGSLKFT